MEGSQRNRSQSVPILSQIEKILDSEEDFGVERRTRDGYSRFPETRSFRNITRPKVRLSSGGLIRKHKRRHSKAVMESTQIGSPLYEQENEESEETRPRAFTTGAIDRNTADKLDSVPTEIETSSEQVRDMAESQPPVPVRSKRCKSLPLVVREEDPHKVGNNKANEIDCGTLNREQTATSAEFYREKNLFRRRLSLPARLQHEDSEKGSHSQMTDTTKSSTVDSTNFDKPGSLITDFDKLSMIKFKRSEQDKEEFFSDFGRRRRSLPCYLEQSNLSTEPVENSNFYGDFKVGSALQKAMKTKTQRSQSLPLTSSRFVGEVKYPLKDEYSNSVANCQDSEYSFRQPLEHIEKSNEQSRQRRKSRKTRSKSLPLVWDEEAKANMSVNLTKHAKQRSLQSHDSLHDMKAKAKRTKSLPFIYESFPERELLSDAQITEIQPQAQSSDSDENERTVSNEQKQLRSDGSIKQKAQLERARSFPLRGQGVQHRQISDIREDLNKAIDNFFSQINDKDRNVTVGARGRSKSLPNVLEGEHSLNFAPVAKILEEKRNIPEIVIAEGKFYDTVGDEESESQIHRDSVQSPSEEEKVAIEESNSDASSDCDELESQISNSTYVHDPPIVARPRGFSIPSSFKMEKIPEEPNENESYETLSSCEHGGTENDANCVCKDPLNGTIEHTAPVNNLNVSEQRQAPLEGQSVDHDEASSAQDETGLKQQPNDYEHNFEIFNKMVTESCSQIRKLEFAESSSCLHRAAAQGDLEHVKLLVEEGNDVNALDESGWPVLHAAVTTGNFDCCAWLIDAGADLAGYTNFVMDEYRMLCRQVYLNY